MNSSRPGAAAAWARRRADRTRAARAWVPTAERPNPPIAPRPESGVAVRPMATSARVAGTLAVAPVSKAVRIGRSAAASGPRVPMTVAIFRPVPRLSNPG